MSRYDQSEKFLKKVEKIIPLGSQTFSKSSKHFPKGVSPLFLTHGKGSHVWDLDGNEYIDFSNALASITLGYQDPDVELAVREQLQNGVCFSLPHPLEMRLAEKIVEMVPCAEMVRFGKNGSDATSGAIRLARAYTKRDHVLVGGYHGWQDWYIGSTTRDLGVPDPVKALTHKFSYNDIESVARWFKKYPDQIAAVILEPMSGGGPKDFFLQEIKELCEENNAILIFDEVVSGFRMSNGGAQEYFGVTPHLSALGKGMANGYPISAITGRADIMRLMEEIFFSFTFGGETLSLAASCATLEKLSKENVLEVLSSNGQQLISKVKKLISKNNLDDFIDIIGYPAQTVLVIRKTADYSEWQIKTLFLQECFSRGILSIGAHNLSYAHSNNDFEKLLDVYDEVFSILDVAVHKKQLVSLLRGSVLTPLFSVR